MQTGTTRFFHHLLRAGLLLALIVSFVVPAQPAAAQTPAPASVRGLAEAIIARDNRPGPRSPLMLDVTNGAQLLPGDGAGGDIFGSAMAFSADGSTLVISAPGVTVDGNTTQGVVYVFEKPAQGWAGLSGYQAKLSVPGSILVKTFGQDVAISNDTIYVGASGYSGNTGAVYVYVKPQGGWATTSTANARLMASDGAMYDQLGYAVDADGDTVVATAQNAAINGHNHHGAAYVFVKPQAGWSGVLNQAAKLYIADTVESNNYGSAVAVYQDTVVIGDEMAVIDGHVGQGAVYIYEKPQAGWSGSGTLAPAARLTATDGLNYHDEFGHSLDYDGASLVIGALAYTFGSSPSTEYYQGAVYVFTRPQAGWASTSTFTARLTYGGGRSNDMLGMSVALDDDMIVAGAFTASFDSEPAGGGRGAAFVFYKPQTGWATTDLPDARLYKTDGASFDFFGYDVGAAGGEIAVGANYLKIGSNMMQGAAFLYPRPVLTPIYPVYLPFVLR